MLPVILFWVASLHVIAGTDSWWKYSQLYEVYIQTFMDSNNDGIGDFQGIISKLDHFVDIGVDNIWVTPFYESPLADNGYDISNFTSIDTTYGTMEDFEKLTSEMKKRGLKLTIDIVINHSSDEHPWFLKSVQKINPYTDYYVWKDPKGYNTSGAPILPNNWQSMFGGPAWEWNEQRKQFYLHQFTAQQPDFNFRNENVKNEIKEILLFWFDKGVTGFRLDAAKHYLEDELFRDEPLLDPKNTNKSITWSDLNHTYTADHPDTYKFLYELREFIDSVNQKYGGDERVMFAEAYTTVESAVKYYGTKDHKGVHYPFNFNFLSFVNQINSTSLDNLITSWLNSMPEGATANWVTDNHDSKRLTSRFTEEYGDIFVMLMKMLPGVACWYYGQEINMVNTQVRIDQERDVQVALSSRRDAERTPMQWDTTSNAGFSKKKEPWLPVNTNYWRINVQSQKSQKISHYNMFKTLSSLRKMNTLKYGDFKSYIVSTWVYLFTRTLCNNPTYITIVNLGTETETIDLKCILSNLPRFLMVEASSVNSVYWPKSILKIEGLFSQPVLLRPQSSLVLSTHVS